MNTMSRKGYAARVEFDERDNIFMGRILGIRSIISFHGETVGELRAEFEKAVEDYVSECKELGLKPGKPASGKLPLRVPPEVHGRALVIAQAAGKSLSQWATEVLRRAGQADGCTNEATTNLTRAGSAIPTSRRSTSNATRFVRATRVGDFEKRW